MASLDGSSSEPKISVIVPVYKVDRYLTQCIDSIVNQSMKDIEIIIVDEGDQDRCREIIDYYESIDSRIIAPHQKNGGYGASCNLGIRMAKGKYISIIESDDFIEEDMYEIMYNYAEMLDADVVKTPYYEYFSNGEKRDCNYRKYLAESLPKDKLFSMKQYGQLLEVHASLWSGLYRTEYMHKKGIQFVEAKGAAYVDVGFRIDTLINTDKVAWLDEPFYNYRIDSVDSSTNNFKIKPMIERWHEEHLFFESMKEDYDKYYGPRLIIDEYYNTIGYYRVMDISDEDTSGILENMKYVSDEMVMNSPCLSWQQKKDIIDFKNKTKKFIKECHNERKYKKIKNNVLSIINLIANEKITITFVIGSISSYLGTKLLSDGLLPITFDPFVQDLLAILTMVFLILTGISFFGKLSLKIINRLVSKYNKDKKNDLVDFKKENK